jgi:hypothetical protein
MCGDIANLQGITPATSTAPAEQTPDTCISQTGAACRGSSAARAAAPSGAVGSERFRPARNNSACTCGRWRKGKPPCAPGLAEAETLPPGGKTCGRNRLRSGPRSAGTRRSPLPVGPEPPHRFLARLGVDCRRRSASSWAFAAKTSATASLNSRPCSTRGRICSTHSSGIRSTRFLPWTMKVSDQRGWPSPSAQWQVGVPQRRWVRAREPGKASGGICQRRSRAYLRCRKRAARSPWASYQFSMRVIMRWGICVS